MVVKTFRETFEDKSTAASKLDFLESTFAYAVFNKEQKRKKFTVTDQKKSKLYIVHRMLRK